MRGEQMTVAGDMAAYVHSNSKISMSEASHIIALALEGANDPNFALRFAKEYEWENGFAIYMDVVRFLKEMNQ
jgi:hypothetical protein